MKSFAALCLLLQAAVVNAAGDGTDTLSSEGTASPAVPLREVTVVGGRGVGPNPVDRLGSQVTVVSRQQIEVLTPQDLLGALRLTPGVVLARQNPVGGGENAAVFIRGHDGSRLGAEVLVTMDEVPRLVGVWAQPQMDVLSIDNAERLEVYKGPQPVLFGNMAFSVINIVPKRMPAEGFVTWLHGAYGSHDTVVESVEHGGKSGALAYYLVQSYRASSGHRPHSGGELQNYFGSVEYALDSRWTVGLLLNRTNSWAEDPGTSPELVPPSMVFLGGRYNVEDFFTIARLANRYERAEGSVKFYWERGDINWVNQHNSITGLNDQDTFTDYDNYGIKAREAFCPWDGGELRMGIDVDYISGKAVIETPPAPALRAGRSVYRIISPHAALSHRFTFGEDVHLTPSAGFRYMIHDTFDNELAPQAGVVLDFKASQLHASYARGVNFPGVFVQTINEFFHASSNAADGLRASLIDHYEIGFAQRLGERVRFDCTLFYDDGCDRIVIVPPPPFPPPIKNEDAFRTKGVEGCIALAPTHDLALFAGFTYLEASPADLPYTPKWSASCGVTWKFQKQLQLSVDAQYVGKHLVTAHAPQSGEVNVMEAGASFLLNAKVAWDFQLARWNFNGQIFVAGENLTDTSYQQRAGYPMPGVSVMTGVRVRF